LLNIENVSSSSSGDVEDVLGDTVLQSASSLQFKDTAVGSAAIWGAGEGCSFLEETTVYVRSSLAPLFFALCL
jgi:hypothetical protein